MKIGIIIVFHNNELLIDKELFARQIEELSNVNFCLVNNESKDNTYEILKEIKELTENVSVVNIKKFKSDVSAIKAGARFMFSQSKYKHLGYVNMNLLNNKFQGLNSILDRIIKYQDEIIEYDNMSKAKYKKRTNPFQSMFSALDYLTKITLEKQPEKIIYLSKL